jgi:hypothetical protein
MIPSMQPSLVSAAGAGIFTGHWFWDTGCGDLGNQGIHQADICRWVLNKLTHPVSIQGTGKFIIWDSDQEKPNIQHLEIEYEDGSMIQFDVRGLATNPEGGVRIGNLIFGSKGWMNMESEDVGGAQAYLSDISIRPSGYSSYREEAGPAFTRDPENSDAVVNHFRNLLDCVRSRKWQDLNADILEGHLSSSLCHLGNIACRLKRTLHFNTHAETFIGGLTPYNAAGSKSTMHTGRERAGWKMRSAICPEGIHSPGLCRFSDNTDQ